MAKIEERRCLCGAEIVPVEYPGGPIERICSDYYETPGEHVAVFRSPIETVEIDNVNLKEITDED